MSIFVGTPPQKQTVIIDTGSQITAFPCSDCGSNCGSHIDKQFDLHDTSTKQEVTCNDKLFGQTTCPICR